MSKQLENRISRLEIKAAKEQERFERNRRNIFPLDKLMLQHLCGSDKYKCGADLHDAMSFMGALMAGHSKWIDAQLCVTFIALRGLESMGYLTWTGPSRALGHKGYHGG